MEAGATFEFRIAKKPGSAQLELIKGEGAAKAKGGKKYGDLVWPERVLIEMKSRGENLEKHYDQLFEYWTRIVPRRPPYVILCNASKTLRLDAEFNYECGPSKVLAAIRYEPVKL